MAYPILTTHRLRLRNIDPKDNVHVWSASRVPGFTDGMIWNPPETMEEVEQWTNDALQRCDNGEEYLFTIETLDDDQFVGRITLRPHKTATSWNIGYWTHPNQQGKGYMTEAAQELLRFAFEEKNADLISIACATWNKASHRVIEKLGFAHVRVKPQGIFKNGIWIEEDEFEMRKVQWLELHT